MIGVDPPASAEGDACGIVVCGLGEDDVGYVLADLSAAGLTPEKWARKVAAAAESWGADRVVAEANNGGEMVEAVLRGASIGLPVKLVHASHGKAARAEPVFALFESKRAKLAGVFPKLEDELCGLDDRRRLSRAGPKSRPGGRDGLGAVGAADRAAQGDAEDREAVAGGAARRGAAPIVGARR